MLHYFSFFVLFYFSYFSAKLYFKNKGQIHFYILLYFLAGLLSFLGIQWAKYYFIFGLKIFNITYYLIELGEIFLIITFALFFTLIEYTKNLNYSIFYKLKLKNEKTLLFNRARRNKEVLINYLNKIVTETEASEIFENLKEFRDLVNFLINSTHKSLIPIALEMENLMRYVHLYKLRSGQSDTFVVKVVGNISDWQIPHKTILTLVENSIKHGDLNEPVNVKIEFEPSILKISLRNKIRKRPQIIISNNIGLKNLRDRFQLHLGGRHRIVVDDSDGWFEVCVWVW